MPSPVITYSPAGDIRTSGTLAANIAVSYTAGLDFSAKVEGRVTVKVTMGVAVSTTRGVKCEFFPRYSTTPLDTTVVVQTLVLGDTAAANGSIIKKFYLDPDKYKLTITNLDTVNAVTVEITSDTWDSMT